jgi:hypothetical protein
MFREGDRPRIRPVLSDPEMQLRVVIGNLSDGAFGVVRKDTFGVTCGTGTGSGSGSGSGTGSGTGTGTGNN